MIIKKQEKQYRADYYDKDGHPCVLVATVRHDDRFGNGHNSFSVTADLYDRSDRSDRMPHEACIVHRANGKTLWLGSGGCLHDEVSEHIPELAPFIKWHLTSTNGPMHYVDNTIYHATELGPKSAWVYFDDPANGIKEKVMKYCDIAEAIEICTGQSKTFNYVSGSGYRYEIDEKTGKKADIDAARKCAVWPEATKEQLQDKAQLISRLPALLAEFKKAVESLGMEY